MTVKSKLEEAEAKMWKAEARLAAAEAEYRLALRAYQVEYEYIKKRPKLPRGVKALSPKKGDSLAKRRS